MSGEDRSEGSRFMGIGDILAAASAHAGQLHLMGLGHMESLAAAADDLDLGEALRRRWAEMESEP